MKKQCFTLFALFFIPSAYPLLIMLDPAGNASDPGRSLTQCYERKETYEMAHALKEVLEKNSLCDVLISRKPGDIRTPYQNAAFANKLNVDYFIRLHLHKNNYQKPKLYLYQLVFDPVIDFARRPQHTLSFLPADQAHYLNIHKTKEWTQSLAKHLRSENHQKNFDCDTPHGIPLRSLVGIIAPAIVLEASIHQDTDWQQLVGPISFSIIQSLCH